MATNPMVGIYATLVREGRKTLEQVPDTLRPEVAALIGGEDDDTTDKASGA